jgi:Domain of unknown function (DUF1707)
MGEGAMAVRPGYDVQTAAHGHLRAAQADRERAIDVLKAAFAEGRLDMDEFAERVNDVHGSKSYGELADLTADLPVGPLGTLPPGTLPVAIPPEPVIGNSTKYPPTNVFAVLSFLFGLVTVVFTGAIVALLPALICGLIALPDTGPGGKRGRWMAVAGIVIALAGFDRLIWLL